MGWFGIQTQRRSLNGERNHPLRPLKGLRYGIMAILTVMLVVFGLGRSPALASTPRHYTELEYPALPDIPVPEYTHFSLDNGLQVYLLEDHEFPLIHGTAFFQTGDRVEPVEKTGLASVTGEVMRSGGSQSHSADELNQLLEQRAASVETGIDTVSASASFDTLTEDVDDVFGLFAEVIREPAFPQDKIDLAMSQHQGAIARRNDDPDDIAGREFRKLIYGTESPYARTEEYATLANITREDIVTFYSQYFHPNNMLLGIVGDFNAREMRSLIEDTLGDWAASDAIPPIELPTVTQANEGGVFLVDQPQLTQSYIQLGQLGGQLNSPDYAPLSVMNEVLNGFGGRLVNEVRSRQGLAYVVYAYWVARYDYPGIFIAGGQTRTETTVPFVQSVFAEIEKIRTIPITEDELKRAKDSVLNAFVFNFQDPSQTLSRLLRYIYYGYPEDFIFQYQQAVVNVTIDDVMRVAETYLNPETMVTLVVGNASGMQPALDTLQSGVTTIDISIPEPVTTANSI
jgi:zinc protease